MSILCKMCILLFISLLSNPEQEIAIHKVREGDTLKKIALEYQMEVKELMKINNLKEQKLPKLGTDLKVIIKKYVPVELPKYYRVSKQDPLWFPMFGYVYYVQLGDSLEKIGKKFGLSTDYIANLNNLKKKHIYLGQRLYLIPSFRYRSYSTGRPTRGSIQNSAVFPPMPGIYYRKNLQRHAYYGHASIVQWSIDAIARVQYYYPNGQPVVVGDLGRKYGGRIARHMSHRNGLDIDIGYYFLMPVATDRFTTARTNTIDGKRTALLIMGLFDSKMIDVIFIDRSLQPIILMFFKQIVKKTSYLADWNRCIKHWNNHKDHMHVRFKNPATLGMFGEFEAP